MASSDLDDEACSLAYQLRLDSGMTQAALANATGLSVSTISRYETGRSTPSRRTLERLAAGAGVSLASAERDLAEKRKRLEGRFSYGEMPSSYGRDFGEDETSRMIAETMRQSSLRIIQSKLGIDLDGLLPPKPKGYDSDYSLGADRPAEASAVEVRPWLMMRKAIILHAMGKDRKAAEELSFASLTLSGTNTAGPRFVFSMVRSAFLLAAGDPDAAGDLLLSLEESARRLPPPGEELRLRWLKARINGARGQRPRHGAALRELQAEFTDFEMPIETLCAWVDRVALELEDFPSDPASGQSAREELPQWVLESRGFHPSMAEGLATFRALLEKDEATSSVARRFVAFLLCAHIDPGIPFEPSPKPEPVDEFDFSSF